MLNFNLMPPILSFTVFMATRLGLFTSSTSSKIGCGLILKSILGLLTTRGDVCLETNKDGVKLSDKEGPAFGVGEFFELESVLGTWY